MLKNVNDNRGIQNLKKRTESNKTIAANVKDDSCSEK